MISTHAIMSENLIQEDSLSGNANDTADIINSFSQLYDDYFNYVFRYISYRIADRAVVADLTSIVFEKALSAFPKYDRKKSEPQTWLIAIARNTVIDYFRQSAKQNMQPLDSALEIASRDLSPQEQTEKKEEYEILKICYAVLQQREQEIVSLKFGGELNNRRIASTLKLSESNVGAILFRAIRKLRNCFQEWLNGRG